METAVVKSEIRLPKFVEEAYSTMEGMKAFANMLLESRIVPDHFYEKSPTGGVDYTKGKVSSIIVVLLQAQQLNVPPMTALQNIVPINGLLSIKGDLAKTMIFASGKLKENSWQESVEGTIENENMVVSITATRKDNGLTLTRNFSVEKAKRMGLWVTQQMVNGADGYKYKKSAWYKTPDRMIYYRALGFIARDLFPDVIINMYTTEEVMDIQNDSSQIIETPTGSKVIIPDGQFLQGRSEKLTGVVIDKIGSEKFTPIKEEEKSEESKEKVEYTEQMLSEMSTSKLLKIVREDSLMYEALKLYPGKNTSNKLKRIILENQAGILVEALSKIKNETSSTNTEQDLEQKDEQIPIESEELPKGEVNNLKTPLYDPTFTVKNIERDQIKENKSFSDNPKTLALDYPEIPAWDKGNEREFGTMKNLFNMLANLNPPIDNKRWIELAEKTGLYPDKYKDKEDFCRFASVEEIQKIININEKNI